MPIVQSMVGALELVCEVRNHCLLRFDLFGANNPRSGARIARRADLLPDWTCLTGGAIKIFATVCCGAVERSLMGKKRNKMRGTVEKIIKSISPLEPEKAQISISEADDLYREVRVENVVTDESGEKAGHVLMC